MDVQIYVQITVQILDGKEGQKQDVVIEVPRLNKQCSGAGELASRPRNLPTRDLGPHPFGMGRAILLDPQSPDFSFKVLLLTLPCLHRHPTSVWIFDIQPSNKYARDYHPPAGAAE